jgi:hypothetical protein
VQPGSFSPGDEHGGFDPDVGAGRHRDRSSSGATDLVVRQHPERLVVVADDIDPRHRREREELRGWHELAAITTSWSGPSAFTMLASGQSTGPSIIGEMTVAGSLRLRVTQGSRTSDAGVLEASICTSSRNVFAPKAIRWPSTNRDSRWSSSSGPCLPQ